MSYPVDLSALTPRERADVILSQARSEISGHLWRAALGSAHAVEDRRFDLASSGIVPSMPIRSLGGSSGIEAILAAIAQEVSGTGTAPVAKEPVRRSIPVVSDGASTGYGANAPYAPMLSAAGERTGISAPALAAIIDAEAARKPDGSWDPASRNPRSSATGLGQFLSGTWLSMARTPGTWLNARAHERGMIDASGQVVSQSRTALLALRTDPMAMIETTADYARANIGRLRNAGIPVGTEPAAIARAAYIAHHLGPDDALRFYRGNMSADRARTLLSAQIGASAAAAKIADSGNPVLAHRRWLVAYVDNHVKPERYQTRTTSETAGKSI